MNTVLSVQVSLLTMLILPVSPSPTTPCRPREFWFGFSPRLTARQGLSTIRILSDYSVMGFAND